MRNYLLLLLFVIASLMPISQTELYAQDPSNDNVTLVVSGEGTTKDEATKNALRSAIEQAFGTFVSANTTVLNDEIVSDEIVSVASGNIQNYKEISSVEIDEGKMVTLQATVSVDKLISYAQNKGMETEFAGATFAMNRKMKILNEQNELIVYENLRSQLLRMTPGLFDYAIELHGPRERRDGKINIDADIILLTNQNTVNFFTHIHNTLYSLMLSDSEVEEYKNMNRKFNRESLWCAKYQDRSSKQFEFNTRTGVWKNFKEDLDKIITYAAWLNFNIIDNLGNSKGLLYVDNPKDSIEKYYENGANIFPSSIRHIIPKDVNMRPLYSDIWDAICDSHNPNHRNLSDLINNYIVNIPQKGEKFIVADRYPLLYTADEVENITKIEIRPNEMDPFELRRILGSSNIDEGFDEEFGSKYSDFNLGTYGSRKEDRPWFELGKPFHKFRKKPKYFVIYSGAQLSMEAFYNYGRILDYEIWAMNADGTPAEMVQKGTLKDTPEVQYIFLPDDVVERFNEMPIIFYPKSIARGRKYKNFAISEIYLHHGETLRKPSSGTQIDK